MENKEITLNLQSNSFAAKFDTTLRIIKNVKNEALATRGGLKGKAIKKGANKMDKYLGEESVYGKHYAESRRIQGDRK